MVHPFFYFTDRFLGKITIIRWDIVQICPFGKGNRGLNAKNLPSALLQLLQKKSICAAYFNCCSIWFVQRNAETPRKSLNIFNKSACIRRSIQIGSIKRCIQGFCQLHMSTTTTSQHVHRKTLHVARRLGRDIGRQRQFCLQNRETSCCVVVTTNSAFKSSHYQYRFNSLNSKNKPISIVALPKIIRSQSTV